MDTDLGWWVLTLIVTAILCILAIIGMVTVLKWIGGL